MESLVDVYVPVRNSSIKKIILISLRNIFALLAFFIFTLFFIPIFTYFYFASDLQTKDSLMNRNDTGIILTDRNNKPFFTFYSAKNKSQVSLSDLPDHIKQAIISVEDKRFYQHEGVSFPAIAGAFVADIKGGDFKYGGSTITQQLVKNSLLTSDKNLLRKYQELVLAYEVEKRYSKDEILEMYLNSVYFGEGAFGIQEAAHQYFDKDARNLELAESALLAGLLPAPSKLSPISGSEVMAKMRQKFVLEKMREQGFITKEEEKAANQKKLVYSDAEDELNNRAFHFALMVKDQLVKQYGEETVARSGLRVKTTLDLSLQSYAEMVVADHVESLKASRVSNGAAVIENPKTGEVLALVGSADWYNDEFGKVNVATSLRSPGSSFKPLIYAKAFEDRIITPSTMLNDSPITYKPGPGISSSPYSPVDFDRKFRGKVTTRRALSNSLNIPAVEVMNKVGVEGALDMAKRLGISSLKDSSNYGISLILGTGEVSLAEMTNAYATFANKGVRNKPALVLEISNKKKEVIYSFEPEQQKVLDPGVAFLIASILSDNNTRAEQFGNVLNISRPAAVKTGTAEDFKDSLTLGFTPSVAIGVWVGNNDGKPMNQVAGSLGAAPIWKALMERALRDKPLEAFEPTDDVVASTTCINSLSWIREARAQEASPSPSPSASPSAAPIISYREYYLKGTEPKVACAAPKPSSVPKPAVVTTEVRVRQNENNHGRGGPDPAPNPANDIDIKEEYRNNPPENRKEDKKD